MRKRSGIVKRAMAVTTILAMIGLTAASGVMSAVKYSSMTSVGSLEAASSYAATSAQVAPASADRTPLEQFLEVTSIQRFLPIAAMNATRELAVEEANSVQPVGRAGIEQMVQWALPYIAREFRTKQVAIPSLTYSNERLPPGFFYLVGVNISDERQPKDAKVAAAHEPAHAQFLQRSFAPWNIPARVSDILFRHSDFASPLNETFAEIVDWEVLANQALGGDKLAKTALLETITDAFEIMRDFERNNYYVAAAKRGEQPILNMARYQQRPAIIVSEVMAGKRTSYAGIELDGIAKLLRQEIAQARAFPIPQDATVSDLSRYCELPTSELYCASSPLDVRVEGNMEGEVNVFFSRGNNSGGSSSHYVYEPAGQPHRWRRFNLPYDAEAAGAAQLPVKVSLPKIVKPSTLILKDNQGKSLELLIYPFDSGKSYHISRTGELIRGTTSLYLVDMLRELQGRQQ